MRNFHKTSHTLAFTLYLLARNKDKQKKLQEELDSVLGEGKETLTEAQLAKLSYLKACIKESLRLVGSCTLFFKKCGTWWV
ncbi:Cytochrome P450 4c3 [Armadillidium nasatum]|uniref:Cytochrome P450 4c3 n=1 Tax=Armadillidium nasatum TaxID=96803 RepID=A0A5N5ST22_9CRUS|nr:Cytochrome P450 4c3 [Armadillidium nasatum]